MALLCNSMGCEEILHTTFCRKQLWIQKGFFFVGKHQLEISCLISNIWKITSKTVMNNWKAQSKNDPLIFWPFLKVFRSSWILACGLSFTQYTLFWFFFHWFALRFREITYAKNLEFRSGFHWMKPKQKKPFVSSKQYSPRELIDFKNPCKKQLYIQRGFLFFIVKH